MIIALRILFSVVLISMLFVTSWATSHCALFSIPREVYTHPWFLATLTDAYWGFITFYIWVFYQQTSWVSRIVWLVAVLLLGNIAMSAYCLDTLFRTSTTRSMSEILVARRSGIGWLGPVLALIGLAVLCFA